MTPEQLAQKLAEKLVTSRDGHQAVREVAYEISTLAWDTPGRPQLTYVEKIRIVDLVHNTLFPPTEEMTHVGGDNTRTLELIRAVRQLVK